MFSLNKLKRKKSDKTYLKYKNGKLIKYENEEKFQEKNNNEEEKEYQLSKVENKFNLKNLKPKILIITGLLIITVPLLLMIMKSNNGYFKKITTFMEIGKVDEIEQISSEIKDKKENKKENKKESTSAINNNNFTGLKDFNLNKFKIDKNKEDFDYKESTLIKITPETLVTFNNLSNKNVSANYNYLKIDINNFCSEKISSYSTTKNLTFKRNVFYEKYLMFLEKELLFTNENQKDLFLTIRDRYANYINCIDALIENLNRTDSVNTFNEYLGIDNELLVKQTSLIEIYLIEKELDYSLEINEIILN